VKVAQHSGGDAVTDPLQVDRTLDENDCEAVKRFVENYLPTTSTNLTSHATCMYTMTPDKNFIVGKHPHFPQVCFAAGLSGHGFKFTGVLGEILSELALEGATRLPIEFLSPARFRH
jgi:glycine/D-amino acid oxidase-like deaminating enzyme